MARMAELLSIEYPKPITPKAFQTTFYARKFQKGIFQKPRMSYNTICSPIMWLIIKGGFFLHKPYSCIHPVSPILI